MGDDSFSTLSLFPCFSMPYTSEKALLDGKGKKQMRQNLSKPCITWRAIIIALILMPVNSYFAIQRGLEWSGPPGTLSLLYNVVFTIFILIILNIVADRLFPGKSLTQAELITIYTMLCISTALAGHDVIQVIMPVLGYVFYNDTPENEWQSLFWNRLPSWLTVNNKSALRGLFEGESNLYDPRNLIPWIEPILWWSFLLVLIVFTSLCINMIVRKQWIENERLTYPIIQLPYEMTIGGGISSVFLKNRLLWVGFSIAASIGIINGLAHFFPTIPLIPIRTINIGAMFTEKPWNGIGWTPLCFFPFAIGLGFLMPLDVSLSIWFFYLVWKVELIAVGAMGWRFMDVSYSSPQLIGAFIALCGISLYLGRKHFLSVFKSAFLRGYDGSKEPVSYPTVVWGTIIGFTAIVVFWLRAGASLWVVVSLFVIYFVFILFGTRLRAEVGPPAVPLDRPTSTLVHIIGTRRIGRDNLAILALLGGINREFRSHPMPHELEGFKLAEQAKIKNQKRLFFAILIAAVIAAPLGFWAYLDICYRNGSSGGFGWESYTIAQNWMSKLVGTDIPSAIMMLGGAILAILLTVARMRFLWWKLHPFGYAVSMNWTIEWTWFPIFLSWCAKSIILRYGGIKGYRKAIYFFMGLILGDYTIGCILNIIGMIMKERIYVFWH